MTETTITLPDIEIEAMRAHLADSLGEFSADYRATVLAGWIESRQRHRARKAAGLPREEVEEEIPVEPRPAIRCHFEGGLVLEFWTRAEYDEWRAAGAPVIWPALDLPTFADLAPARTPLAA